jgi:restriction system protein
LPIMKIDRSASVLPPDLGHRTLNRWMGGLIAAANPDLLLASHLLACEAQIAVWALDQWWEYRQAVEAELNYFRSHFSGPSDEDGRPRLAEHEEYGVVGHAYFCRMYDEQKKADEVVRQLNGILTKIRASLGYALLPRYDRNREQPPSPMLPIPALMTRLDEDVERVCELAKAGKAELEELVALGRERKDFGRDLGSRYLARHADGTSPFGFEHFVAKIVEKEGHRLRRRHGGPNDDGADVIAELTDGRRAVFQCKQRQNGNKVDKGYLQVVNGTARPVHRADLAVVVTNGFFTKPAALFAYDHDIQLIDRERLRRWATGDRLQDVLGMPHLGRAAH